MGNIATSMDDDDDEPNMGEPGDAGDSRGDDADCCCVGEAGVVATAVIMAVDGVVAALLLGLDVGLLPAIEQNLIEKDGGINPSGKS